MPVAPSSVAEKNSVWRSRRRLGDDPVDGGRRIHDGAHRQADGASEDRAEHAAVPRRPVHPHHFRFLQRNPLVRRAGEACIGGALKPPFHPLLVRLDHTDPVAIAERLNTAPLADILREPCLGRQQQKARNSQI